MSSIRLLAATVSCLTLSICLLWVVALSTSQDIYTVAFGNSGNESSSGLRSSLSFHAPGLIFTPAATISLTDDASTFFAARSAAFGPPLPEAGLSGPLWIGEGFREPKMGVDGLQPMAEGELGCGDVPGWHEKAVNTTATLVDTPASSSSHVPLRRDDLSGKVALLSRGDCGFADKVKWAQKRGATAVIVGDSVPGGPLVRMYAKESSNISIPSVFTSHITAHLLSSLVPQFVGPVQGGAGPKWPSGEAAHADYHDGLWVTLTVSSLSISPFFNTFFVLVVSPLLTLVVVYVMLYIRSRIRRRRWRAPKSVVDRLPVRVYHTMSSRSNPDLPASCQAAEQPTPSTPLLANNTRRAEAIGDRAEIEAASAPALLENTPRYGSVGSSRGGGGGQEKFATSVPARPRRYDGKQVECAVCLEEYEDGVSKVMSLPCGHDFHADCITPWLVTKRRTCPICKGDVVRSMSDIEEPPTSPRAGALPQSAAPPPPLSLNERLMSEQAYEQGPGSDHASDLSATSLSGQRESAT